MEFDDATTVTRTGPGTHQGTVHDGWSIAGNANGGYLMAIAARAMLDVAERPDPVTLTAHYLRPGRPGPVEVASEVVKQGKAFTVVRSTLTGPDGALLALLGTFGELTESASSSALLVDAAPPELPAFEDCVRLPSTDGFPPPFMAKVDLRLHPDDAAFQRERRTGQATMRGWFTFPDGEGHVERLDGIGLLQAADAFPPTIFNTDLPVAWTPTVELTAHVRTRPAPGPLRCAFRTRFVSGGFLEEDGELWDSTGTLVAQSRQLALVPRPA